MISRFDSAELLSGARGQLLDEAPQRIGFADVRDRRNVPSDEAIQITSVRVGLSFVGQIPHHVKAATHDPVYRPAKSTRLGLRQALNLINHDGLWVNSHLRFGQQRELPVGVRLQRRTDSVVVKGQEPCGSKQIPNERVFRGLTRANEVDHPARAKRQPDTLDQVFGNRLRGHDQARGIGKIRLAGL